MMNIWGYNSSIWPYCCISWRNMCHQFTIYHREKVSENDICDLEPSSVYNCMALIVFGQTARLISSSSLVPAGWQAAGQLQQGSMEQVIPHNKCAHTTCLSLHFSEPYMLALQFADMCHTVEGVCQPRTAKRALLRKINGVSATVKFAPDGVSTWSGQQSPHQVSRLCSSNHNNNSISGWISTGGRWPATGQAYIIYTSSFHNSVVESEFKLANIMIPSTVGVVATP